MHRRWLWISAAAALIVASLTLVLLSDGQADADRAATTPTATVNVPDTTPSPSPRTTGPTAKPSPSRKPSPSATTAKPRPSATRTPQKASATGALAGRIRPGVSYRGLATFYDSDGTGACMYDASKDVMTAAMNHTDYETAKACGAYVTVRAADGASVTVRVTNECPECAPGHIDLSAEAFARLAAPSAGQIPVTWELASPADVGTLSVRYKTGSSSYWCAIQVIGHRNPVARLEVGTGGGWRQLPRAEYNYFLAEDGGGCGGPIRITDIHGQRLTVEGIGIRANVVQPTRVQFPGPA
ncbi:expansin EXLX1 family cellulose-binding protein [Streptomyces cinnabarinus]|uniref:Expansin EXLX1 family cellulose-binding protein n=1 Tax=Streptomyces cinnabarinus TaxID=67287 RepID=A0ABY7K860_9ACTN|nr:expansin EXLX1 family cellulose-binding protein [Streptomyces cinnabarinus]WAZ19743.1 expansin EXLX1 family cellulose-binding protein [Streptomyces cinnabarinus]